MKKLSFLLVFLILLQSCSLYHKPTTVESALVADSQVRIITTDNKKYKFRWLESENDRLMEYARRGTTTAGKLAGMPVTIEGKYLKADLSNLNIEEINLRNKTGSKILTFGIIAASIAWASIMIWSSTYYFDIEDWPLKKGNF